MLSRFIPRRPWLALLLAIWLIYAFYLFAAGSRSARMWDSVAEVRAKRRGETHWVRQDGKVEHLNAKIKALEIRNESFQALCLKVLLAYVFYLHLQLAEAKRAAARAGTPHHDHRQG